MDYFIAYPKSGSNWMLFLTEYCTGRPHCADKVRNESVVNSSGIGKPIQLSRPCVVLYAHDPRILNLKDDGNNRLIFMTRELVEVCVSFYASDNHLDVENLCAELNHKRLPSDLKHLVKWHKSNRQFYDGWRGPKKLVSYCELIESPEKVITELCGLFPVDRSRVSDLTANLETYREAFLKWKAKPDHMPVITFGRDLTFFRKRLNSQVQQSLYAV